MVIYQKKVDGIIYEQHVVATEEPERVKELVAQGWSKVEPPTAKEVKASAPSGGAEHGAANEGTAKAKEQ